MPLEAQSSRNTRPSSPEALLERLRPPRRQAANQALATRENQGNLAPVNTGAVFLLLSSEIGIPKRYIIIYVIIKPEGVLMVKVKATQIGSSIGVVLPKEILSRHKIEKGDTLFVIESPDGLRITPYDPDFEEDMSIAREVMRKRRDLLRELAK
jgi:putative addiction module antidote